MAADKCIKCGGGTSILETRACERMGASAVRRRRQCLRCHHRWTTVELPMEMVDELSAYKLLIENREEFAYQLSQVASLSDRILTLLPVEPHTNSSRSE